MNKRILTIITYVMLALISISFANAYDISFTPESRSLTVIENDFAKEIVFEMNNLGENETYNLTIEKDGDLSIHNNTNYYDLDDDKLVFLISSTSNDYGTKEINFIVNNISHKYEVELITLASPPIVEETSPEGIIKSSIVTLKVITNEDAICKFDTSDKEYSSMRYMFQQNGKTHIETWQLENGDYDYYVRCMDSDTNVMQTSKRISFTVDMKAPSVVSHSPKFTVTTSSTKLQVRTDEDATCKYSSSKQNFDDMTLFSVTNGLDHYQDLHGLKAGSKNYNVLCIDNNGNIGELYNILFTVDMPPTAVVQLSTPSPIRAGTVAVTVVSSEDLQNPPILKYKLDAGDYVDVPLTGAGKIYSGYMIIDALNKNQVGEFKINMVDAHGVSGSEITQGNGFVVQTKILPKIRYLTAESQNDGDIEIRWYLDQNQDDAENYYLYRSTKEEVTNIDFYKKVSKLDYVDSNVDVHTTYYYRVAAVDKANNVGILSETVKVTSKDSRVKGLNDDQKEKVDELIYELEKEVSFINSITYPIDLDRFLGLSDQKDNLRKEIKDKINDLEDLKEVIYTDDKLSSELDNMRVSIRNKLESLVTEVKKTGITQSYFTYDDYDNKIIDEYLKVKRVGELSNKVLNNYLDNSKEISQKENIVVDLFNYDLYDNEGNTQKYTLLRFESNNEDISFIEDDVDLILNIPKSVANDVSDFEIKDKKFITINRDPIISFDVSKERSFAFDMLVKDTHVAKSNLDELSFAVVKKANILFDKEKSSSNLITGNSISNVVDGVKNNIFIIIGFIIIAGLVVYLYFNPNDRNGGNNDEANKSTLVVNNNKTVSVHHHKTFENTKSMLDELKKSIKK